MRDFDLYEKCLIGIIKDVILNGNNAQIPAGADIGILTDIIKVHKLSSLVYPYLEAKGIKSEELSKDFNLLITIDTNQQYCLEKIKKRFEQEKIRFMCIKGAYLKTLYPEPYMRSSNDLDIFADDENADRVRGIMQELGFSESAALCRNSGFQLNSSATIFRTGCIISGILFMWKSAGNSFQTNARGTEKSKR